MSIKNLFSKKTKTFESAVSASKQIESKDLTLTINKRNETFYPFVDFSSASNFAKFGSAEEYYSNSIERIYENYPYDGSENEKLLFEMSSSYLDKYIFEQRYPKTNGYIKLSGPASGGTKTDGYGSNPSPEYIYVRGGLHVADGMEDNPLQKTFDKSIVYNATKQRVSGLRMNIPEGITTEFWLKKEAFNTSTTEKEVILDLWNGEPTSSSDYGRFTLALSGTATGIDTFIVTMQSGTSGFYEQTIGTSTVTTSSLSDWHHYALSFISASAGITSRLYVDGELNESKSLGSTGLEEIGGLINGYIGALQTSPSGSSAVAAAGTLSASIDEFRYWKTRRTSEEIYNNWYRHVGGGTNTDDANVELGVYYKFNEGIVGTTSTDSVVLDYSGRLANGTWVGYSTGARFTGSAFTESGLVSSEAQDPIIYSSHPDVSSLKDELEEKGRAHDELNPALLYKKLPHWIKEEDEVTGKATKYLYQIMASYFDTLHAQITALPSLKNKVYPSSSYKPLPFADRLLEEKGIMVSNLFTDASILEFFGDRDLNQIQFEQRLTDVKNQIYTNIYNNLENILKEKGTESSIRNMLRCFGIDDELVKLNIYTDGGIHYFTDTFKHTALNKKFIDFNKETHNSATLFQTSSTNHPITYISGSGDEKLEQYNAFTSEISIMVPKKVEFPRKGFYITNFQSASVFGMHQAATSSAEYDWDSPDLANFQVYLVRDELESSNAKFVLKDYSGNFILETPVYKEIYSNEQWNLAVRIKPEDYPIAGNVVTSSNRNYQLEFYGVNHAFDVIKNEFSLTQSLNYATGSSYLSNAKRFYIGSHRTNFTGSVLEKTDIKVGRFNLWYDYIGDEAIKLHNKDITSKGNKNISKASTIFGKDLEQYQVPTYELLTADWDFESITTSDVSGEFVVIDASSGSTDSRYGWMDNIIRREHRAKGFGFPSSDDAVIANEIIYSSKKELPEISYSADRITIKEEHEEYFIEDEDVSDNFYSLEKSMYQTISEEMMKTLSTVQEMSNLVGQAIERYRVNYKHLDLARRLFFEDVEEDPDFDRYTEYFKWIDSSISFMISQLFPVSARFSKGISDVVESHIFERNKYHNKFPITSTHSATEGRMVGIGQSKYQWKFGHAPLSGNEDDNCLWQKERAERTDIPQRETIRQVIGNRNNAQPTAIAQDNRVAYSGSTFAIRRFSKPVDMKARISQTYHPGTNYNLQKDREYIWSATNRHSALSPAGFPKNVLLVGAGPGQGVELSVECNDVEDPNQKKKFNTKVYVGKHSAGTPGGTFTPIDDSLSYAYAVKGALKLPFDIFSGSVTTGYNARISSGYKSDAVVTNLHSDTTDFSNDLPLQGPFTQQWVGGHQSRHIDLNRYDETLIDGETLTAPTNNIQNLYTRPEAWRLLVVEAGGASDGALGMVDAQYGLTDISGHPNDGNYPDVAKKSATLYRDLRTKRPVNVANIQTTTSSVNHGNFVENYEIVSAVGKQANNLFFRKNSDIHDFLPSEINNVLPQTTNYQTLIGVSNHPSGNVFGIGESNILNASVDTLVYGSPASMTFALTTAENVSNQVSPTFLEITGASTQVLAETVNTEAYSVNTDIVVESNRRALRSTSTTYALASNSSYSGIDSGSLSISFWINNTNSDLASSTQIQIRDTSGSELYIINLDDDTVVNARTSSLGTYGQATFDTRLATAYGGEWKHIAIVIPTIDLTNPPELYIDGNSLSAVGYSHNGGSPGNVGRLFVYLDDEYAIQDLVIWDKSLSSAEVTELYNSGDWMSPESHSADSNIVDWYQMGNEDYWYDLGYNLGDSMDTIGGSITRYISSSYGTGDNPLLINSIWDEDLTFTVGKGALDDTVMFDRLSSSLASTFTDFTVSYSVEFGGYALYNMIYNNTSSVAVDLSVSGPGTFGLTSTADAVQVRYEKGYFNTTTIATGSVTRTVISSRFSAPGSIDTMTYGFLDAYSQEYSAYNSLNYRNLSVRGASVRVSASADGMDFYNFGGSGEAGTIRVDDHRGERDGLKALLSRHSGKFGIDARYAVELGSEPLEEENPDLSFHKQQRNENRRPSDTSTIASPVLITRHDNAYINSSIPRSDFQYKWVTSSLGDNYSITSGKQRMYGYAHPTGILSSSVVIDGDSGFVPAITFPTASEIFGE